MKDLERRVRLLRLFAALLLLFFVVWFVPNSGLVKENNPAVDRMAETARRLNVTEGILSDFRGRPLTSVTEEGDVLCDDPESFGYLVGYLDRTEDGWNGTGLRYRLASDLYKDDGTGHGRNVRLTVDSELQRFCTALLQDKGWEGSILVLENGTGALRAFASWSGTVFDVNDISSHIEEYNAIPGFWLRKGDSEADPPGSTAKILTAACALENGIREYVYDDGGREDVGEGVIYNWGHYSYGELDMDSAFCNSVNTYFASLALELGKEAMEKTAADFLLGQDIELDFTTLTSCYRIKDGFGLASAGFGQGEVSVSPLQLAMITSVIPNEGKMRKPYLIDSVWKKDRKIGGSSPEILARPVSRTTANAVAKLMEHAAQGYGLGREGVRVGAKTGTAECADGTNHTYLVFWSREYTVVLSRNNCPTSAVGKEMAGAAQQLLDELYGG